MINITAEGDIVIKISPDSVAGITEYKDLIGLPSVNGVKVLGDITIPLGIDDYNDLNNLPTINGIEVKGTVSIPVGSNDYNDHTNKPKINGIELVGDKSAADLGMVIGASASAGWVYPLQAVSTVNPAYKTLSDTNDPTETEVTAVASTGVNGGVTRIGAYLFPLGIDVAEIPSGVWNISTWRYVSNATGDSFIRATLAFYHLDGSVTVAYAADGQRITDIDMAQSPSYERSLPSFPCLPTDRVVIYLDFVTDRNQSTTLHMIIGGAKGFRFSTPLAADHGSLRRLEGNPAHLHVDSDQKYNGALPTGVASPSPLSGNDISTIAKLAGVVDTIAKKYVEDLVSAAKTVTLLDGSDIRLGTLASLNFTMGGSRVIASIAFTSGITPTVVSAPVGVKWAGADCGTGLFAPKASKRYNVVVWDDAVNINAIVTAV